MKDMMKYLALTAAVAAVLGLALTIAGAHAHAWVWECTTAVFAFRTYMFHVTEEHAEEN